MTFHGRDWVFNSLKGYVNLGIGNLQWWISSCGSCSTWGRSVRSCFVETISLRSYRSLVLIIVTLISFFSWESWWKCIDMRGGSYRVVSKHGSTLGLDELDSYFYACIVMVKVIVHEVIACILFHNYAIHMLWSWHFLR